MGVQYYENYRKSELFCWCRDVDLEAYAYFDEDSEPD